MHVRISMSELNEREDRSMIAHARDECARRILFFRLHNNIPQGLYVS